MYPITDLNGIQIMPFAENLVTLRRASNLTQRQLAEMLGISLQQVKNTKRNEISRRLILSSG
jgi:transcriptional regulator with XRE-family HTH domain